MNLSRRTEPDCVNKTEPSRAQQNGTVIGLCFGQCELSSPAAFNFSLMFLGNAALP